MAKIAWYDPPLEGACELNPYQRSSVMQIDWMGKMG